MSKNKKNKCFNALSTMAISTLLLGAVATPAFAAPGDYFDQTAKVHYSMTGLTAETRAALEGAYASGHSFAKELSGNKYLDYNAARTKLEQGIVAGTPIDTILGNIVTDGSMFPVVDPSQYTDGNQQGKLKVDSVNAINASQIKIVFSQEVNETSAELPANVTLTGFAGTLTRELQSDNKTLLITTDTPITTKTEVIVAVKSVAQKDDASKLVSTYTGVVTVEDKVKPEVTSIVSKASGATASDVVITYSELVKVGSPIKIDGVVVGATTATSKQTVTGLTLDATKAHTLEIVNLTDTANNITSLATQSFSITVDTVVPKVTSVTAATDNSIYVTFDKEVTLASVQAAITDVKSETLGTIATGTIAVTTPGASTSDTKFIVPITDPLYATTATRNLTVVIAKDVTDLLGNKSVAETKTISLTKDAVKPAITGLTAKFDSTGKTTNLEVTFSEGVAAIGAGFDESKITVIAPDGTDATTGFFSAAQAAVVAGDKKASIALTAATDLDGVYTFIIAKDAVSDLAQTANTSAAYTKNIDFGAPASSNFTVALGDITISGDKTNTITVDFQVAVKGGAVAGSATDVNNYTLGGKALPTGTIITLNGAKDTVTIDLPDTETIAKNDTASIFTISGVQNSNGAVVVPVSKGLSVFDNSAPELKAAQVVGDSIILTFDENMAAPTSTLADALLNYEIKCGSTAVGVGTGSASVALVTGDAKKVQITFTTTTGTNWDATKAVTIKTLGTATTTDANTNVLKDNVTITATK